MFKFKARKIKTQFLTDEQADPFLVKEGGQYGHLKDPAYQADWVEQSFLSDEGNKEALSLTFNFAKLKYFYLVLIIALGIIIGRSVWLQVVKGDYYRLLAEGNRLRSEVIEPKRGIIYDKDLRPLVRNKANFVLYLRPIDLPREELVRDELLREISAVIEGRLADSPVNEELILATETDSAQHLNIISDSPIFYQTKESLAKVKLGSLESYQPLFVAENIEYERAIDIMLHLPQWPGVFLSSKTKREYLLPLDYQDNFSVLGESSLAHLLGYTGKINQTELTRLAPKYSPIDYLGKAGIENSWETELRGVAGNKSIEVDALGRQKRVVSERGAIDGDNLQLTLDLDLQLKSEEILQSYLDRNQLSRGVVIIMNPNNGEILSLVSLPAYNNNLFARGISQTDYSALLADKNKPLLNRAIGGEYPSGSTIKPIFAAGALEEGVISANTKINSVGGIGINVWFFPDWKAGGHGLTDVRKAIAESVNTFFYYIGGGYQDFVGLGIDRLVKYAKLFGLGTASGLDLPGELSGLVPSKEWKETVKQEAWYIGDTYHVSIGQGDVLTTPLQVLNYTAAIANGGTLYQPRLVKNLLSPSNEVVQEIKPTVIRSNFISSDNLKIVREGMRQTITAGSAQSLGSLPIAAAGKTGTAQWSSRYSPHAWFIAFAPYEKPELALVVLVEEGVEGSTMAAPIAREILAWYFDPSRQAEN